MDEIIAVLIGGAVGSLTRFLSSRYLAEIFPKNFPWGIFIVNIIGCFLIGLLMTVLLGKYNLSPAWRAGIFIGFLGGLTTFSSFSWDTFSLLQSGAYLAATVNIFSSVLVGLLATCAGVLLGRVL